MILLWLVLAVVYLAGFLWTAVQSTRILSNLPYCHEDNDRQRAYCLKHHRKLDNGRCWRTDGDDIAPSWAVLGSFIGLVWPLAGIPLGVYLLARRGTQPQRLLSSSEIQELERKAGLS